MDSFKRKRVSAQRNSPSSRVLFNLEKVPINSNSHHETGSSSKRKPIQKIPPFSNLLSASPPPVFLMKGLKSPIINSGHKKSSSVRHLSSLLDSDSSRINRVNFNFRMKQFPKMTVDDIESSRNLLQNISYRSIVQNFLNSSKKTVAPQAVKPPPVNQEQSFRLKSILNNRESITSKLIKKDFENSYFEEKEIKNLDASSPKSKIRIEDNEDEVKHLTRSVQSSIFRKSANKPTKDPPNGLVKSMISDSMVSDFNSRSRISKDGSLTLGKKYFGEGTTDYIVKFFNQLLDSISKREAFHYIKFHRFQRNISELSELIEPDFSSSGESFFELFDNRHFFVCSVEYSINKHSEIKYTAEIFVGISIGSQAFVGKRYNFEVQSTKSNPGRRIFSLLAAAMRLEQPPRSFDHLARVAVSNLLISDCVVGFPAGPTRVIKKSKLRSFFEFRALLILEKQMQTSKTISCVMNKKVAYSLDIFHSLSLVDILPRETIKIKNVQLFSRHLSKTSLCISDTVFTLAMRHRESFVLHILKIDFVKCDFANLAESKVTEYDQSSKTTRVASSESDFLKNSSHFKETLIRDFIMRGRISLSNFEIVEKALKPGDQIRKITKRYSIDFFETNSKQGEGIKFKPSYFFQDQNFSLKVEFLPEEYEQEDNCRIIINNLRSKDCSVLKTNDSGLIKRLQKVLELPNPLKILFFHLHSSHKISGRVFKFPDINVDRSVELFPVLKNNILIKFLNAFTRIYSQDFITVNTFFICVKIRNLQKCYVKVSLFFLKNVQPEYFIVLFEIQSMKQFKMILNIEDVSLILNRKVDLGISEKLSLIPLFQEVLIRVHAEKSFLYNKLYIEPKRIFRSADLFYMNRFDFQTADEGFLRTPFLKKKESSFKVIHKSFEKHGTKFFIFYYTKIMMMNMFAIFIYVPSSRRTLMCVIPKSLSISMEISLKETRGTWLAITSTGTYILKEALQIKFNYTNKTLTMISLQVEGEDSNIFNPFICRSIDSLRSISVMADILLSGSNNLKRSFILNLYNMYFHYRDPQDDIIGLIPDVAHFYKHICGLIYDDVRKAMRKKEAFEITPELINLHQQNKVPLRSKVMPKRSSMAIAKESLARVVSNAVVNNSHLSSKGDSTESEEESSSEEELENTWFDYKEFNPPPSFDYLTDKRAFCSKVKVEEDGRIRKKLPNSRHFLSHPRRVVSIFILHQSNLIRFEHSLRSLQFRNEGTETVRSRYDGHRRCPANF